MHQVEVGWMHAGKEIRTPRGSGIRKPNLPKSCKKGESQEVKPPFSQEGKSPMVQSKILTFQWLIFRKENLMLSR